MEKRKGKKEKGNSNIGNAVKNDRSDDQDSGFGDSGDRQLSSTSSNSTDARSGSEDGAGNRQRVQLNFTGATPLNRGSRDEAEQMVFRSSLPPPIRFSNAPGEMPLHGELELFRYTDADQDEVANGIMDGEMLDQNSPSSKTESEAPISNVRRILRPRRNGK